MRVDCGISSFEVVSSFVFSSFLPAFGGQLLNKLISSHFFYSRFKFRHQEYLNLILSKFGAMLWNVFDVLDEFVGFVESIVVDDVP